MYTTKYIISAILIITLLSSGLPLFSPEDANRDSSVTLEDVILHVRDLARSAENPTAFAVSMKKTLSTLYAVAGLKTVIKKNNEIKFKTQFGFEIPYLISSNTLLILSNNYSLSFGRDFFYESIVISPDPPLPCLVS